ncbi:DUF433 domain-containing protein [Candidatus Poribacteria bacterium]|nr:DUF433 domain-containing protein [Candidatus Poribacteria bacterium]MYH80016.1 DUF433 domain-containing protein [Candidatus Poribacteria bacterium]MYK96889.1 DUF433 domain-containing protein [Candidatus Poribacteria bacterium]
MELEDYFDFVQEDVIRIKGNRIDIEIVLEDYLEGASPEEILLRYPTLNLEKIHATILYYLAKTFGEQAHQNNEMVPECIQFVLFDEEAYACYVKEFSNLGFGLSCQIG